MRHRLVLSLMLALSPLGAAAGAEGMHTHMAGHGPAGARSLPAEGGQAAFAAIAEIVALLEADPATDWRRVDMAALREHLVDMDEVMLRAEVAVEPVPGGIAAAVNGVGRTREAIRRMVPAHAAELAAVPGWNVTAAATADGVRLVATSEDPAIAARIRGLGFFGLLASGSHHQPHHLAIARGERAHGG